MVENISRYDIGCCDEHQRDEETCTHSSNKTIENLYPFLQFFQPPHRRNPFLILYFHSGGKATTLTPLFSHSSLYIFTTSLPLSPFPSRSATHFLVTSLKRSYHLSASLAGRL